MTVEALRRHQSRHSEEALRLGAVWGNDLDLVFTTSVGTRLNSNNVLQRVCRPLLKKAGLPTILSFHDLQDIAVSLALTPAARARCLEHARSRRPLHNER